MKILAVAASLALAFCSPSTVAAQDAVKLLSGPLTLEDSFGFVARPNKEPAKDVGELRRSASGLACIEDRCLIVFDEGRGARWAKLTQEHFKAEGDPVLVAEGDENRELDLEGAASAPDGAVYVVGSHANSRKAPKDETPEADRLADGDVVCERRSQSHGVFRLANGKVEASARLDEALERQPKLQPGLKRCLKSGGGLDIEGVAFADGRLHFGFRGPKPSSGGAYVLSVSSAWLFEGAGAPMEDVREVATGDGRAIRDMAAVKGGFLLLVGPDDIEDNEKKPYSIRLWEGDTVKEIGEAPRYEQRTSQGCDDEEKKKNRKPEGLAVTSESETSWTVVVVSDGLCDGGPTWYEVKKP